MKSKLFIAMIALLSTIANPSRVQATDYYVDQGNSAASDSNSGSVSQPWKTITKANQTVAAGDTVYVKAGTYTSYIAPGNSGTASSPITYRNYGGDTVTISNTTNGILISGKSYIVVQGINFYLLDKFLTIQNGASHNTIAFCNFDQGRTMGWAGSQIVGSSQYNWIHDCRFSRYGTLTTSNAGTVLDIGDENSQTDNTRYNLIENNTMFAGGHHVIGIMGKYNVIRNNYFHNEIWTNGYGDRIIYVNGYAVNSGYNLIEGNRIGYAGPYTTDYNSSGILIASTHNIVRRNLIYHNDGSGIAMDATANYISDVVSNEIYNNAFFGNGWDAAQIPDAMTSAIGMALYGGSWVIKNNSIKNNVFYNHYQTFGTYRVSLSDQAIAGNWDGNAQGDPKFVNASKTPGNPADSSLPDLHVQAGSPCVDGGTHLTTITSASGSGVSFKVTDAGYFMDGWGISGVPGDEIRLIGSTQSARITSVDYSTGTITVDRALSWSQNQGLALSYEGSAPDIGAYESALPGRPPAPTNLRMNP